MSTTASERDPLLSAHQSASVSTLSLISERSHFSPSKYGLDLKSPTQTLVPPLGPLEITASARHGILAGIWLAQFLSVSWFIHQIYLSVSDHSFEGCKLSVCNCHSGNTMLTMSVPHSVTLVPTSEFDNQ